MATINIFASFEFDKDNELKNNFYQQAIELTPHRVKNCSLNEAYPDDRWQQRARAAIEQCDVMIILIGQDTHNAPGVKTEVRIARRLRKPIFQIRSKKRSYSGVNNVDLIRWKWDRINRKIEELCGRR